LQGYNKYILQNVYPVTTPTVLWNRMYNFAILLKISIKKQTKNMAASN
jgi:hypothetical protein